PKTWEGTRGRDIMEQLKSSQEKMPLLEDRIAVAMDLFRKAMQGHWIWQPTGASAVGSPLLDKVDNMAGECKQSVSGLESLLGAPKPYGLALLPGDVTIEEWPPQGSNILLFVVDHKGPIFGLHPNVLHPNVLKEKRTKSAVARFEDLYVWGNHKVLKVNCSDPSDRHQKTRYFDPCYDNVYVLPNDMARYTLTQSDTVQLNRIPVVDKYRGKDARGRPVAFKGVGSGTPEVLQ